MNLQVIGFACIAGDSTPAAARKVTATPLPGQVVEAKLVDRQVLTGTTGETGETTLTLIKGISYDVRVAGWGSSIITVDEGVGSQEAPYAFTNYLLDAAALDAVRPTANFLTAADGTTWQLTIIDNGDGSFSPQFARVA